MTETARLTGSPELMAIEAEVANAFPLPSTRRVLATAALTLAIGFGGITVWAFATPVDRAVVAQGTLIAEGRRKSVTLLEPAILRELAVKEGEHVRAGQVLLQLDTTAAQAAADQAKAQYWGGLARIARLQAEARDERRFTVPEEAAAQAAADPGVAALVDSEKQLFRTRWEAFDGALTVQQRQVQQFQEQLRSFPAQRQAAQHQLAAVRERIAGLTDLLRFGAASRFRILELRESEASLTGQLGTLTSQEAAAHQQIAQAQSQMAQIRLQRQQDVANDLQVTQNALAQAQNALRQAMDVLRRREVTAPEDGVVTNIQFFTPGSSINAGQPILDLVPAQDRLVVEAQVRTTDVEQVHVGQQANIRLTPYRQRTMPLIPGRVIYVSADRQVEAATQQAYFVARVELDQAALQAQPGLTLSAGMPTESYLLGERRTVASYLIAPVRDSMRRAFRD